MFPRAEGSWVCAFAVKNSFCNVFTLATIDQKYDGISDIFQLAAGQPAISTYKRLAQFQPHRKSDATLFYGCDLKHAS